MMRLNLIVIKTAQIEALKKQYEALGLSFKYHQHGKGPFHYSCEINGLVFEIYPLPKSKEIADHTTRLGFEITNLDVAILELEKTGWIIISSPTKTNWGYVAVVKDLDGRKVELKEVG